MEGQIALILALQIVRILENKNPGLAQHMIDALTPTPDVIELARIRAPEMDAATRGAIGMLELVRTQNPPSA